MALNLCDTYRPKTLQDVYGQDSVTSFFRSVVSHPDDAPRYFYLEGGYGCGKCVSWDSWVKTPTGISQISNVVPFLENESPVDIPSFSVLVQGREETTTLGYYSGYKPTKKVHFYNGFQLEGTLVHPIRVWNPETLQFEWKQLQHLQVGDCAVSDVTPIKFNFESLDPDAYLMGLMLGDGTLTKVNSVSFESADDELISFVQKHYVCAVRKSSNPNLLRLAFSKDSYVVKLLQSEGLIGKDAYSKQFPRTFSQWSFEKQLSLLQGLMDTDGTTTGKLSEFCSASYLLASGVAALCNGLGLTVTERIKPSSHVGEAWADTRRIFIHHDNENASYLFNLTRKASLVRENSSFGQKKKNIFPGMNQLVYKHLCSANLSFTREEYEAHPWIKNCKYANMTVASVLDAQNYLASKGAPLEILSLYSVPAFVTSIQDSHNFCYDLTLPEGHQFVAQGIVNHNTTVVRAFAASLLGPDFQRTPNYIEIDSSEKRVAENFEYIKDLIFQEVPGWKVVLFDEAHLLPTTCIQQFLKILEDYTGNLFIFFASTETQMMFPPLLSRLLCFSLQLFTPEQCVAYASNVIQKEVARLNEEGNADEALKLANITPTALNVAAQNSQGHLRSMLKQVEIIIFQGEKFYLEAYSKVWTLLEDYFYGSTSATDLIPQFYAFHPTLLRSNFSYYFRDQVLNPSCSHYGKIYPAPLLPKLFQKYLQLIGLVKSDADLFTFLYAYRQILEAVRNGK